MRSNITDSNFRTIGYTETKGGKTYVYKAGGHCLGHYDEKADSTYKAGGSRVGKGNSAVNFLFEK